MAKSKSKEAAPEPKESKVRTRVVKFKPMTKLLTNNLAVLDEQIKKSERVKNVEHFIEVLESHLSDEAANRNSLPEFIESALLGVNFFKTDKDTILEKAVLKGLENPIVRSTSDNAFILKANIDSGKEQSFWVKKIAFEQYEYGIDNFTIGKL